MMIHLVVFEVFQKLAGYIIRAPLIFIPIHIIGVQIFDRIRKIRKNQRIRKVLRAYP